MKLIDLQDTLNLEILRDGVFDSLGKATHRKGNLLVFLESQQHLHSVESNENIAVVVTTEVLADLIPKHLGVCVAERPREVFYAIHDFLSEITDFYGTLGNTNVHQTARVDPLALIPSQGVEIGANAIIEGGAIIHERTIIEDNAIVRSGAVIGAEGFEFYRRDGVLRPVQHTGGVILKEFSEIQSGTVVEKAVYGGNTIIGRNTKIGGNALIAHNTEVGDSCLLAGGVTVSGNVIIENSVWIGPGATISNGISIGEESNIALGSTVVTSTKKKAKISPVFAADKHATMKFMAKSGLIK